MPDLVTSATTTGTVVLLCPSQWHFCVHHRGTPVYHKYLILGFDLSFRYAPGGAPALAGLLKNLSSKPKFKPSAPQTPSEASRYIAENAEAREMISGAPQTPVSGGFFLVPGKNRDRLEC
jgi:hypothetical protein